MSDSILTSVKKVLGIAEDYTVFDPDFVMHINSTFTTLRQLGIGPEAGFMIEDVSGTWSQFLQTEENTGDPRFNSVKSYMCLKVRMLFDPPTTSYLIDAYSKLVAESEWRLNVEFEKTGWVNPDPDPYPEEVQVIDGGTP